MDGWMMRKKKERVFIGLMPLGRDKSRKEKIYSNISLESEQILVKERVRDRVLLWVVEKKNLFILFYLFVFIFIIFWK